MYTFTHTIEHRNKQTVRLLTKQTYKQSAKAKTMITLHLIACGIIVCDTTLIDLYTNGRLLKITRPARSQSDTPHLCTRRNSCKSPQRNHTLRDSRTRTRMCKSFSRSRTSCR